MDRKVILIGGGHSHVQVLESLANRPLEAADVTVVVDRPIAIYSGMVPGFVAGQYRARELQIDVPELCRWAGVDCVVEPVQSIDAAGHQIGLAGGQQLAYDVASINVGSTVAGLDLPGIRQHAIPTRPISELLGQTDRVVEAGAKRGHATPVLPLVDGVRKRQRDACDDVQGFTRSLPGGEPRDEDHDAAHGLERQE